MHALLFNRFFLLLLLAGMSALLYVLDFTLVGSWKDVGIGFLSNLAFLPVYVLIVTLVIERVLRERERQAVLRKLNMVIGVFFSEVGNRLLHELSPCVLRSREMQERLLVKGSWNRNAYAEALEYLRKSDMQIDSTRCDKEQLKAFLVGKREFLVGLLENQSLLEHEKFTDLLWAVFHLVEELEARENLQEVQRTDMDHINGDIKRVMSNLSREWLLYMQHLQSDYPYLFSLAVRLNPMVENPDPQVY